MLALRGSYRWDKRRRDLRLIICHSFLFFLTGRCFGVNQFGIPNYDSSSFGLDYLLTTLTATLLIIWQEGWLLLKRIGALFIGQHFGILCRIIKLRSPRLLACLSLLDSLGFIFLFFFLIEQLKLLLSVNLIRFNFHILTAWIFIASVFNPRSAHFPDILEYFLLLFPVLFFNSFLHTLLQGQLSLLLVYFLEISDLIRVSSLG